MKITSYSIEETFNKIFLWRYSKNSSYIRQLISVYFEKNPTAATKFWESFKIEIKNRVNNQIFNNSNEWGIQNLSEQTQLLANNWEFIINECLMCFSPYHSLVIVLGQSMEEFFDNVANWFLNQMGWISVQLISEIKELQYPQYHIYNKQIREMFSNLSNVSVDLFNYKMTQPSAPYVDAMNIADNSQQDLSIMKFKRLVRNLNIENKILRKFDLKMVNAYLNNSCAITRNVMLTVVIQYAIVSKTIGKKPTNLNISEQPQITYNDVIREIENFGFSEEEFNYLYDVIQIIEASGMEIETFI